MPTTTYGFESGDLAGWEYTDPPGAGTLRTEISHSGTYCHQPASGGEYSRGDVPMGPGDTLDVWLYAANSNAVVSIHFGVQSLGGEAYSTRLDYRGQGGYFGFRYRRPDGTLDHLNNTLYAPPLDEWLRLHIEWGPAGELRMAWYDTTGTQRSPTSTVTDSRLTTAGAVGHGIPAGEDPVTFVDDVTVDSSLATATAPATPPTSTASATTPTTTVTYREGTAFPPAVTTTASATATGTSSPRPATRPASTTTAVAAHGTGAVMAQATPTAATTVGAATGTGAGLITAPTPSHAQVTATPTEGSAVGEPVPVTPPAVAVTATVADVAGLTRAPASPPAVAVTPTRATVLDAGRTLVDPTPLHGYERFAFDQQEWHEPVLYNYTAMDSDVPLLTTASARSRVAPAGTLAVTSDLRHLDWFTGPVDTGTWAPLGGLGHPTAPSAPTHTMGGVHRTTLEAGLSLTVPADYDLLVCAPYTVAPGATLTVDAGGTVSLQ